LKILLTGSSGFLGKNIVSDLRQNYIVSELDLSASSSIQCNLAKSKPELSENFNIVLHAAGKAHSIPQNQSEIKDFFDVNYQGTVNLCKALEKSRLPNAFIFISTVAVYGIESGINITEESPLNGTSPYALSKIKAEEYLTNWSHKNNVTLTILRPSLIAGPNPPGNLGTMIQGIKNGKYLSINGGKSRKSVLMVQDIANLVSLVAYKGGIYNVCDSEHPSFGDLEKLICRQLNRRNVFSIPYLLIKPIALIGDMWGDKFPINSKKLNKITKSLTFSNEKARTELNWTPLNVLENFKIQ